MKPLNDYNKWSLSFRGDFLTEKQIKILEGVVFMSEFLKGNFKIKREVDSPDAGEEESLEKRFEREALKKLGGSIAFVSKKKVLWGEKDFKGNKTN